MWQSMGWEEIRPCPLVNWEKRMSDDVNRPRVVQIKTGLREWICLKVKYHSRNHVRWTKGEPRGAKK